MTAMIGRSCHAEPLSDWSGVESNTLTEFLKNYHGSYKIFKFIILVINVDYRPNQKKKMCITEVPSRMTIVVTDILIAHKKEKNHSYDL